MEYFKRLLIVMVFLLSGCDSSSSTEENNPQFSIPLGEEVIGLTLESVLSGKQSYSLDTQINPPNCWSDSVVWTGSELYFALGRASFTKLLAGQGLITDLSCNLPRVQVNNDYFDIYKATLVNGKWQNIFQNIDLINTEAGVSVSGSTMAYTVYSADGNWELFLTERVSENVWGTAIAFEQNSLCPEDNANIYANGTKVIFESTRLDALGNSCDVDTEKKTLWFSQKIENLWSVPRLISGSPNLGDKNTQPWVDEVNEYLYWTADTECACIRRVKWVNDDVIGNFETVITPAIQTLSDGTADGKIVFVGEYSHSDDYAFFACAKATKQGDGTDPNLFKGEWAVNIDICVVPRE